MGDYIFGGIFSLHSAFYGQGTFEKPPLFFNLITKRIHPKNYQHVLAAVFAVHEINKDPMLLSNITLGFRIVDNYYMGIMTYLYTLQLLTTQERGIYNYICDAQLLAIVGGLDSENSIQISNIVGVYKIPQISYGSFDAVLSDKIRFPFFYRMIPNESLQFKGIIQLLLHFSWKWIGIMAPDNNGGEKFLRFLTIMLSKHDICVSFTQTLATKTASETEIKTEFDKIETIYSQTSANVVVASGDSRDLLMFTIWMDCNAYYKEIPFVTKVLIMTAQWDFTAVNSKGLWFLKPFHGALSFTIHTNNVPGFQDFLDTLDCLYPKGDIFIQEFCLSAFKQGYYNDDMNSVKYEINGRGKGKMKSLPGAVFERVLSGQSYSTYNSVHILAQAFNAIYSYGSKYRHLKKWGESSFLNMQQWQLHRVLKAIGFNNSAGDKIYFNEDQESTDGYDIVNCIIFPNESFSQVKVGRVEQQSLKNLVFTFKDNAVVWNNWFNQTTPHSFCTDNCQTGYYRQLRQGKPVCCYDCIPCPEDMISNTTDAQYCSQCPDDEHSSQGQDECIPKSIDFLSYTETLGILLASSSIILSFITVLILIIFIKLRKTPLVKANNRDITYALLFLLLLCFLSSLLFIGKPRRVTCLLQQIMFGLIFTAAVSSVLAKTITVILVFKAIQPGSKMRTWLKKSVANSIMLLCFLGQFVICVAWLSISPPFPDLDLTSQRTKVIVKCNEGSVAMFYCVLSYMGFLAFISFIVASFARNLPDSFNEAKFITFSLLVFCSVWVSFVPTYLSTKGKYMVAVEIFCILASGAGLLGCIFFPKCYIIIVKPGLNCKDHLIRKVL
ncbi:PREDICTED: vomeronasal type-2 receptor 26-like [Thamnophis sirtalis]|uniref:Vomeronasal type-2 receptor 26-like n=1 Tax=Thamnophis sirtalis TaxID=35019 RepID=A0A6I9X0L8_9SAUR|nr:PREDICTED: vomeronasal type-2 receptor 26-like [Thamnophis sirtalis]